MYKPPTNICGKHDEIYDLALKLSNIRSDRFSDIDDLVSFVQFTADEIMDLVKLAKNDGCKMENRMMEYREAIEGLGFKRSKKNE